MNSQNEFTPNDAVDLASWNNMVTVNVHATISSDEQLADVANKVLANYKGSGKVLRSTLNPRRLIVPQIILFFQCLVPRALSKPLLHKKF